MLGDVAVAPMMANRPVLARREIRRGVPMLLAILLADPSAPAVAAEAAGSGPDAATASLESRSLVDGTIFHSHLWLDSQWTELEDGGGDGKEKVEGLFASSVSPTRDWAVRVVVPYAWHVAGDLPGDVNEQGLGDVDLAVGTAFRHAERRTALALELRAPTAEGQLGDDVWRLKAIGYFAWDRSDRVTFVVNPEYSHSISEEEGAAPQSFLETFFLATFLLPHRWWTTVQYEVKVDFEQDESWTHSARLFVGKQIGETPLRLLASIRKQFDGGPKRYQADLFVAWFFG